MSQLISPCVSICALDENDICVGCFRSGGEISIWGLLSDEEKREEQKRDQSAGLGHAVSLITTKPQGQSELA